MTAISHLTEALEAYKPEIAERFRIVIRTQFTAMFEELGPSFKGVYNHPRWCRVFKNTIRPLVKLHDADFRGFGGTYRIDEDRLEKAAKQYADDVSAAWLSKIQAKLGELDSADVRSFGNCGFVITGTKAGKSISIEQHMILNVSAKGTLFNQFPARIYLESKFISEAKFKKLAA